MSRYSTVSSSNSKGNNSNNSIHHSILDGNTRGSSVDELKDYFRRNNRIKEFSSHSAKIHTVNWNCDGRRLGSGSFDKAVCVFQLDQEKLRMEHVFREHTDAVDQICWHPSHPDLLSSASVDKTVRIWDARAHKCVETFLTKGENINITWSPDGKTIAAGNRADLVTFIDFRAKKIKLEQQFKFEVNEICWNPASDFFFVTNGEGYIYVYDYPGLKEQDVLKGHTANCICIEFHPSGDYFAVGSADAVVSLWDAKELACIRTFSRLEYPVRTISFNHNGTLLASASEEFTIDISYVETGEKVTEVTVESATFTIAWHPRKNLLAFAGDDKDKYERDRESGALKLFGLPTD